MDTRLGFRFINNNTGEDRHSSEFPTLLIRTQAAPLFASRRTTQESIIDRDGQLTYVDGYNNKTLTSNVRIISNDDFQIFEDKRSLAKWLSGEGQLILDIEPDKILTARLLNEVQVNRRDIDSNEFILAFDVDPIDIANFSNNPKVGDPIKVSAQIPVGGLAPSIINDGDQNYINFGNYRAAPVITISGTADSITITNTTTGKAITVSSVTSDTTLDFKELVFFDGSGNKGNDLSGDLDIFIEVGDNLFNVSGTNLNTSVAVDYRQSYI